MINWRWPSSHCQPIGLDIGSSSIKMIQLAIDYEHVRVLAADKVRIDCDVDIDALSRKNFIIAAIKQMLAENNFHGRTVVSNLPNDNVKITSLRLTEQEEDKIAQVLRKEAAVRFGLAPDKDMVDYVVAGSVQQGDEVKNELIVFAAADEAIRDHIKMLEEAKLQPVGIDAVPCALFRNLGRFLRRHEDKERTIVLIDIGSRYTTVVFSRGDEISFVKQIPAGVEKFNQQIASRLQIGVKDAEMLRGTLRIARMNAAAVGTAISSGLDGGIAASDEAQGSARYEPAQDAEAKDVCALQQEQNGTSLDSATRQMIADAIFLVTEELVREVSLCLKYYTVTFRGNRIERVIVTGGGAYEGIVLDTLRRQLGVEVEAGQPLRGFDIADVRFDGCSRRDLLCEWAIAVGLSLKGYKFVPCVGPDEPQRTGKRAFDHKGNYEGN